MRHIGYYLNLDRSPDRRAAMDEHLVHLDPPGPYHRFAAADGNTQGFPNPALNEAEMGCFTSHYLVLQPHLEGDEHLHILEDDTRLAHRGVRFLEEAIAAGMLDDLDMLFTSTLLSQSFAAFKSGRESYESSITRADDGTAASVRFGRMEYFSGTGSYLVNRRSVGRLSDILGEELSRGARRPIDIFIREEARSGRLRVRSLFPFISTYRQGGFSSTIRTLDDLDTSRAALGLLRHSFFVECDHEAALERAKQLFSNLKTAPHEELHSEIAGFLASDAFRPF